MNNDYSKVGLYPHNIESYKKVKEAYNSGERFIAIVHGTGTGKSYNALQLIYDIEQDSKIEILDIDEEPTELNDGKMIYVVPSNAIIEHLDETIEKSPNLDRERDFPNLEFWTYQKLITLSREEIEKINIKLLIVDEFHHIGAPVWGLRIEEIIKTHPKMKVFGMTAYTVRDRGTPYERDMVNPDTNEIFSNKVVSRYDIVDAMIDGVLPKPIYKSAKTKLYEFASQLEEKVLTCKASNEDKENYQKILKDVKARITEAPTTKELIQKNVKPNSKCIYFCPPGSVKGVNDIETIKQELLSWFKEYIPEEDIIIYTTTSDMGIEGKKNRDAFYNDLTLEGENAEGKLRVMLAINQYNEGVHSKNVDTVILGRSTSSDIVYFEQIGRANSVKGNTTKQFEEYEKYSIDELKDICKEREIPISENASKIDIIERIIAPTIIDLTDNYEFIKQLETNLKDRVKEYQKQGTIHQKRIKTLEDTNFDIEVLNQDLFEMLKYVKDRLTLTWEDKYELAKAYYNHYGNLEIPRRFKTLNGICENENGVSLGEWLDYQRSKKDSLSQEKIKLLEEIGMQFEIRNNVDEWNRKYELAKAYYNHYGNLEISFSFKTLNGIDYDEKGIKLGIWINNQRRKTKSLTPEKIKLLEEIGMRFKTTKKDKTSWEYKYKLAKVYYNHNGNLEISQTFKTINGIDYDEAGINLGIWINNQRIKKNSLSPEKIKLLEEIGMRFERKDEDLWNKKYELAKAYYNHHGNLKVLQTFKTVNGIDYDEAGIALGAWIMTQKNRKKYLTKERRVLLEKIGMQFENRKDTTSWEKKYELAKVYYNHHGNLEIPSSFKTLNGIDYDENGLSLGSWIRTQRNNYGKLSKEKIKLLSKIGMRFENKRDTSTWEEKYELAKNYYNHYGNLEVTYSFKTLNGIDYNENGLSLGSWIHIQRNNYGKLPKEKIKSLSKIGMRFETRDNENKWNKNYELAKLYYNYYGNLEIHKNFKTLNGTDYDENGINLGNWIMHQRRNKYLPEERRKLLDKIGMRFETRDNENEWNKNYKLAKIYYNYYGNLEIKSNFKTLNGIDYNENGVALGSWINRQKQYKEKLSEEKIIMLNEIGIIWYSQTNKYKKQEITAENTNFVKAQLLNELKQFLETQKDMINSKEDVENISNEFNEYVGKRK